MEQTEAQLLRVKSEIDSYSIKKQRAQESLDLFIADIEDRKKKVEKDFNRLKNNYELDIAAYPDVLRDLNDQKDSVMQSIADAIGELKLLQDNVELQTGVLEKIEEQKDLALVSIDDADGVLIELEEEIDDKREVLAELKKNINIGELQLNRLKEDIISAEIQLTDLRADLQTRKNAVEDDMKITIQKSTDVVKRLQELEKRESKINSDLATRIKAVELREQVMARKEAKLSSLEQKAQEYAKFMKL